MIRDVIRKGFKKLGYRIENEGSPPPDSLLPFLKELWPVAVDVPMIRCGGDADGAYILPDDLDGIAALFSPGVEQVATFETEMASRGMKCYLADASVESAPVDNPAFRFDRKYLGLRDTDQYMTLDSWVERYEPGTHDLLLQIDIEGAEWAVLASASDALIRRFRIIVLELHSMGQLLDQYGKQVVMEVLSRLLETHYVVHNHPNNWGRQFRRQGIDVPDVMETTLLRKDRATPTGHVHRFPHPLDINNNPAWPVQSLPVGWYAPAPD